MTELTRPLTATADWQDIIGNDRVDAVMVSATPETLHHPMAKAALEAGKHVLLEKRRLPTGPRPFLWRPVPRGTARPEHSARKT